MSINEKDYILNKIIELEDMSNVDVNIYLIDRDKEKDNYYFSKNIEVELDIKDFLKKHIIKQIKDLKKDDLKASFPVQEYNQEFQLTDYIGRFNFEKFGTKNKVVNKMSLLKKALNIDLLENIENFKFQLVSLTFDEKKVYFCFYKGMKKFSKTNKYAIFSSNEFRFIKQRLLEFGGKISFFFDDKDIYIVDPKNFEYAFDYRDHISKISGDNINEITSMNFFPDEETKIFFRKAASHHLLARGLASIKPETLKEVDKHFKERLTELKEIKDKRDELTEEQDKKEFVNEIGELNLLIDYIDFDKSSIIFKENDDPKPLLHFFQDKIMTSFLTKKVRVAMGL